MTANSKSVPGPVVSRAMFRKGWSAAADLTRSHAPSDPELPQLAYMLNGPAMLELLGKSFDQTPPLVSSGASACQVVNVRYRPGRECTVSYTISMPQNAPGSGNEQIVCVKAMSAARAKHRMAKRLEAARKSGGPLAHWPDENIIATAFPYDLRIAGLHRLMEPRYFEDMLRRVSGKTPIEFAGSRGGEPAMTVASYRPERSCLLRAPVGIGPWGGKSEMVFARAYRDGRGEGIACVASALWSSPARREGRLFVPQPLGYDRESRTFVQRQVAGTVMPEHLGNRDPENLVAAVGQSLAALHDFPIRLAPARSIENELDWIATMVNGIAGIDPELGVRMNAMVDRLRACRPRFSDHDRCLIHGDFSMNQVLVHPKRVSLLDFDDAATGNAYADLGTFVARMDRYFDDPAKCLRTEQAFCRHYRQARRFDINEVKLNWYTALGFTRLALSAVGQLRADWQDTIQDCLGRAEARLGA